MGGQVNTPPLAHVHIVHKLTLNPEAKLEGKNEDDEVIPLVTGSTWQPLRTIGNHVTVTRVVTFTTDHGNIVQT